MLHAKFLRSPYAHAKVVSVDTTKARALPGVVDILTWEDEDIVKLSTGGFGPPKPWLDNVAHEEGAEVAVIVVAESEEICEEALRLLDVEWEVLPHIVDILEGRKPDAPVIREGIPEVPSMFAMGGKDNPPKQGNISYSYVIDGDIEAGFKEADHVIEYDLTIPAFASHA